MPKVSIIIPVYNTEKYLSRCLDSIIDQTLDDYEVIIIDDSSTDHSPEIISEYARLYPEQVKTFQTTKNSGVATARNIGLEHATGAYIGFIDSDDVISPDMYADLLTACEETGAEIARSNRRIIFKGLDVSFLGRSTPFSTKRIIYPLTDSNYLMQEPPCCTNKLFKSELARNQSFPPNLKWEDYPYALSALTKTNAVVTVPKTHYFYTVNLTGTTIKDTRKVSPRLLDIFTCSDLVASTCLNDSSSEELKEQIRSVQIINCLQRFREIIYSNISFSDKKELLNLVSDLITIKYGPWQNNSFYKEQCSTRPLYGLRMGFIEKHCLNGSHAIGREEETKAKIKTKLHEIYKNE